MCTASEFDLLKATQSEPPVVIRRLLVSRVKWSVQVTKTATTLGMLVPSGPDFYPSNRTINPTTPCRRRGERACRADSIRRTTQRFASHHVAPSATHFNGTQPAFVKLKERPFC